MKSLSTFLRSIRERFDKLKNAWAELSESFVKKRKFCFIFSNANDCENMHEISDICREIVTLNANPRVSRRMREC